jgi:uncharacterized membrane protein
MSRSDGQVAQAGERPPRAPGFVMGLGLGGFIDGIVLHQVLQWHHLLTDTGDHPAGTVEGLEANTLADGLFHVASWAFVVAGMVLTVLAWQRRRLAPPWRSHLGMLLAGWGAFNLVEGTIDHQLLGIHHVRDDLGGPLGWDLGFLALGALLVVAGVALARSGERAAPGAAPRPAGAARP